MSQHLAEYGHVLLTRWRWVLWGVLSALLITTVALLVSPPAYRSEATVFVRTPGDVSRVRDGGDLYARARVGTYAVLAKGTGVSTRVVADLGLDVTAEDFSRRVHAEPRPNTALLDLSAKAPSASEAQRGVTVLISELQSTVQTLEAVPGLVVPRAELVVVDPPGRPVRVFSTFEISIPAVLLGVSLLGAALGAVAAVIRSAFSDSISAGFSPTVSYANGAPDADVRRALGRHRLPRRKVSAQPFGGYE